MRYRLLGAAALVVMCQGCGEDASSTPSSTDTEVPAPAAPRVTVEGRVRDEDGEPLAAAIVEVRTGAIGTTLRTVDTLTDAGGRFTTSVTAEAGGEMLISASSDGHVDRHRRAAVSGAGTISTSLALPYASPLDCVSGICSGDGIALSGLPGTAASTCRTTPSTPPWAPGSARAMPSCTTRPATSCPRRISRSSCAANSIAASSRAGR